MPNTYRVRRPIKVGEGKLPPGALVPEAITWFRVDHLVHAGFITFEHVEDDELMPYLLDRPELLTRYGYSSDLAEQETEPDEQAADLLEAGEKVEPVEVSGNLTFDEGEPLISGGAPDKPSRAELEAMEWDELRHLAMAHGLKGNSKREDILDALAGD